MNNSVFGKTMENIENRVDIRLKTDKAAARKLSALPNYDHCTIFDENLLAIHMKRIKLYYNKPVYLGMCILDLSKNLMFDFHFNYIKAKYADMAQLLYTDTDSLIYEIETDDVYSDISGDVEAKFDTSEYLTEFIAKKFPVGKNKKVIGMFKDEVMGKQIEEFVGLRPKLYSYKVDEDEVKKCKGTKKSVVKKRTEHKDLKNCLFTGLPQMRRMNIIRSRGHQLFTEEINKVALNAEDDKRVIQWDGVHTLAIGHYRN